jgi:hypothetical protein
LHTDMDRANTIAQWAYDTRPILTRFHLWLEDVRTEWLRNDSGAHPEESISFVSEQMERLFTMTAAVTALGTKLFGGYGKARDAGKAELNQVKKDADAISAYAMSECLWYLSRSLPENHAIMVCLGEGLMPKAGETPEMGSNPMLGFGRIYARPQVAAYLDLCVQRMINESSYSWDDFRGQVNEAGITIWGTAIDTLENTSRFARGDATGPMTVLHIFDQPLAITRPYEGYIGNLIVPAAVARRAAGESLLIEFFTPRSRVLEAIRMTYPDISAENVHVWTLTGKSREHRIGRLWEEWRSLGVHLVEDGYPLPGGARAFTGSGTYAPTYSVGSWTGEAGEHHLLIVDGYAASAEAIQAASLCPVLDLHASLAVLSSRFKLDYDRERLIMQLDPEDPEFRRKLQQLSGDGLDGTTLEAYQKDIVEARGAGIPLRGGTIAVDDFLSAKRWEVIAVSGFMLPDPYSDIPGVKEIDRDTYEVTARMTARGGDRKTTVALRLLEDPERRRLVFNPLLNRFMHGEDYRRRPVKISDSGRIRNELQTLCSEALEHVGARGIRVHFDKISTDVIPAALQKNLKDILEWYKTNHPIWFSWLDLSSPHPPRSR